MRRGLVVLFVAVLIGGAPLPVAHADHSFLPTQEETRTSTFRGTVRSLVVDSDGGDVIVRAGRPATVTTTEEWVYRRPSVRMTFRQGVLTVTSRCPTAPLNECRTDITAAITETSTVETLTTSGNVRVSGITSSSVVQTTRSGHATMSRVAADVVKSITSDGTVAVRLSGTPTDATLRSGNGPVAAILPSGTYTLDVGTNNGRVHVSGITNRRNSGRKLTARTRNGDITISGR